MPTNHAAPLMKIVSLPSTKKEAAANIRYRESSFYCCGHRFYVVNGPCIDTLPPTRKAKDVIVWPNSMSPQAYLVDIFMSDEVFDKMVTVIALRWTCMIMLYCIESGRGRINLLVQRASASPLLVLFQKSSASLFCFLWRIAFCLHWGFGTNTMHS
mmetsp:Transcript_125472/g.241773  ORF Transcript_125472/g.241773 Transcript_125472/m.241773 type:complete len:156 (-) Transcript_125472:58-525(-)